MTQTGPARIPARLLLLVASVGATALLLSLFALPVVVAADDTLSTTQRTVIDRPPLPEELPLAAQVSTVHGGDGEQIAELSGAERREPVDLEDVPQVVIDAVLAVEDDEFYEHNGVDHQAMVRAAARNVTAGEITEGASTITQQLVKMLLLDPEQTLERKMHEVVWAVEMEREYGKDEILDRYLNAVYLGDGAYGFGTAAEHYFSKPIGELTIAEAATLAGAIQAPSATNPVAAPEVAQQRRDVVIRLMEAQGRITAEEAEEAIATPLELDVREPEVGEPFWIDLVKRVLYDERVQMQPEAQAAIGDTVQERIDAIFEGGLQIHTTLDPGAQQQASESLANILTDPASDPLGAVISLDHTSGALRTLALGPREFGACPDDEEECHTTQINPTVPGAGGSGRQSGSAFKPFVAATALHRGAELDITYDTPSGEPIEGCGWDPDEPYAPRNYGDTDGGEVDMVEAMRRSNNVYFVKLARAVGVERVIDFATDLGIRTSSNLHQLSGPDCAVALGAADVFPIEMVTGYGVWANGGVRCEPFLVERIVDRWGETIYEHEPRCEQVIDEETADTMRALLRQPVGDGGTAPAVGRAVPDAWGKTGTTNDFVDAWFVGGTPGLTTAAWVGYELPQPMENITIGGERYDTVTGGTVPGRIWADYHAALE